MSTRAVSPAELDRPIGEAIRRGARGRCPACGQARIFTGYLKVKDHCPACGEALHHHRADDGPAYLTILIVSHLAAPRRPLSEEHTSPLQAPCILVCRRLAEEQTIVLLPIIKGGWVGFQWAKRMHGFGDDAEDRSDLS